MEKPEASLRQLNCKVPILNCYYDTRLSAVLILYKEMPLYF